MTKEEFEKLSDDLKMEICREIAYAYTVFVPKDEQPAILKFKSFVNLSDLKFLDRDALREAKNKDIFPYHLIMQKAEQLIGNYYREFVLETNAKSKLAHYGSRGETFRTYFTNCLKESENSTKEAVKQELFRCLGSGNDAKSAIEGVGNVIVRRTRSLGNLLQSLSAQMEQCIVLWEYGDRGYTKYRINAVGESCEVCQSKNGKIFDIANAAIGETLTPLHPNCNCVIEILDARGKPVYTHANSKQEMQDWGKYLQSSLKQLVMGNYTDDVTLIGTALQVLAGAVGIDLPMDVRDLIYDVTNFEPTKEHIAQTLLDAVAVLPVIGGIKYADEAGAVIKSGVKSVDEVGDVLKSADEIADAAKAVNISTDFAEFPKKIHLGRQGKHIIGHNNYIEGRSILTITPDYAEKLIQKFSGTGEYINGTKEKVDFKTIIGKYVNSDTKKAYDTTVGTIHYSKDGAHIVPTIPNDWKE